MSRSSSRSSSSSSSENTQTRPYASYPSTSGSRFLQRTVPVGLTTKPRLTVAIANVPDLIGQSAKLSEMHFAIRIAHGDGDVIGRLLPGGRFARGETDGVQYLVERAGPIERFYFTSFARTATATLPTIVVST